MQVLLNETGPQALRRVNAPSKQSKATAPPDRQCRQASAWLRARILEGRAGCSRTTLDRALAFHFAKQGSQKRMRLALETGNALAIDTHCLLRIAASCEIIHNASLIHDDLQDRQRCRRDQEALWQRFGPDVAICAGDYLLSRAYSLLAETKRNPAELISITHQAVARLIRGQCQDLDQRRRAACGPARCREIAIAKSADLIALPVDLCLVSAGKTQHRQTVRDIAEDLAVGYQAMDDIHDQSDDELVGSPNLVNALAKRYANPVRRAESIARQSLEQAKQRAETLPRAIGGCLAEMATHLLDALCDQSTEASSP